MAAAEDSMLQESRITYKSISTDPVPPGLREIAAEITTVVLIAQPVHLYSFIADYLQDQLMTRDSNESPSHRMIRNMVENELTYEAMLKRWGVSTALANYAATIIQAVYRGHRTRLAMAKKTQEADQVVEEKHSEVLCASSDSWETVNKAATLIQRNFRQIAGKPRQEKPPGEPQQRRRPRRAGPPTPHQPSEVATAPAELIPAHECTAKEAAGVAVVDPVQPSSSSGVPQPVEVEQGAKTSPTGKRQSKTSVAAPRKQASKQGVGTPRKKESKQTVATPGRQEVKRSATAPQRQTSKQRVATQQKKEAKQSVTKLQKQVEKQGGVGATLDTEEAKESVTKLQEEVSEEGVDALDNKEANQSVTKLQQQVSEVRVTTLDNDKAKEYVTKLQQQGSDVRVTTLDSDKAKQSVTKLEKPVSEVTVATSDNKKAKQPVTKPRPQVCEKGVSTSDVEEMMQMKDSTIPLSGVAESYSVVLPIVDSLLWYVVNYKPRDAVSDDKDPVEIMSSSASQQVAASRNDAAPDDKTDARSAPKLESLYASSPNQDDVFTSLSAQSRHVFVDGRRSFEADMSAAMFVDRYESISVIQPPSRAAIDVESQEFYQAQESVVDGERAGTAAAEPKFEQHPDEQRALRSGGVATVRG